jgi:DNA-binding protein YbaB
MNVPRVSLLLLLCLVPLAARAQDSGAPATSGSTPAAKPAVTPPAQPTPDKSKSAATPETKKPKKVWTNDEIKSVKGGVSVVGDDDSSLRDSDSQESYQDYRGKSLHQQQVNNYRAQIQDMQRQIDAVDQRISQLKNFKGENTAPSGGINPNQGYNMVPLEDQVKQLEERKKQLKARIEDLENDAKKNGISPGELR